MKSILTFLNYNQQARFLVLFLIFIISFALNLWHWKTSLELVIASSFLPFFGYLAVTIGKQTICILYYGTKGGMIDPQLTSLAREENRRVSKVIVKDVDRTNAYASNFDGSIILTRKLVDVLSDDETKAILYHEISHISVYPALVRVLAITFVLPALLLFLYSVLCFGFSVLVDLLHQFVEAFYLGFFVSSFLFCMILLMVERKGSWVAEYSCSPSFVFRFNPVSCLQFT